MCNTLNQYYKYLYVHTCASFFTSLERSFVKHFMSSCNQISVAAKKVTMIRRVRNKKNLPTCSNHSLSSSSVVHQTNNATAITPAENSIQGPKYMNTYRLDPKNPFNCTLVHGVLEEVVQKQCFGVKYDPVKCATKVQILAGEILRRVKSFQFDRYRFVVVVQISSNHSQEIETVAKFLWDTTKDRFVTYNLKSGSMFTTVTCFGIYQD